MLRSNIIIRDIIVGVIERVSSVLKCDDLRITWRKASRLPSDRVTVTALVMGVHRSTRVIRWVHEIVGAGKVASSLQHGVK